VIELKVSMDFEANAMYYRVSDKKVVRTKEVEDNFILVDYADDDTIVGVEILNMNKLMEVAASTAALMLLPKEIQDQIKSSAN